MLSGIVNFYKPVGMSSHTAANKVRRALGADKAGHTGTLDPYAEGVLPILIGNATRFSELLVEGVKKYTATIHLGHTTTTLDSEGEDITLLPRNEINVTPEQLSAVLDAFKGEIEQAPPMYSACSVGGVRLYKLAREGVEVERPTRKVTIYDIELLSFDSEEYYASFSVTCSKGTYIRTLADDIGRALNCGAMLAGLVRTETGGFSIDGSLDIEEIEALGEKALISVESRFLDMPIFVPQEFHLKLLTDGQRVLRKKLGLSALSDGDLRRIHTKDGVFVGIGKAVTFDGEPCFEFFKRA